VLTYDLPRRGNGRLLNGWRLNSFIVLHGGEPFTIRTGADTSGTLESTQRVNQIGNPYVGLSHKVVGKTPVQWINPAAFAAPAPGTFGTMRRNQLFGPGFEDVDLSVFKDTTVTERVRAQFRVEMFNVFNHVNLGQPGATFGTSSFGISSSTIGTANGAPGIGAGEPFNMQLALKILF